MATLSIEALERQVATALERAGAVGVDAEATARALVLAEAQALGSHGLSRVAQYATPPAQRRVDGRAVAVVSRSKGAVAIVDAGEGLAFPACELAVKEARKRARQFGIGSSASSAATMRAWIVDHLRPLADAGMVGLGFTNSPAAMPAAAGGIRSSGPTGGRAVPRRAGAPLMIDLSLSEVARGKLMVAAKEGRPIPAGWALDADGNPTTDPKAGLAGSMLPVGAVSSPKGAMLALVVELLVTALIGANFGFEASSFFVDEGNRPASGSRSWSSTGRAGGRDAFLDRLEVLVAQMLIRRRRATAGRASRSPAGEGADGRRGRRRCRTRGAGGVLTLVARTVFARRSELIHKPWRPMHATT
jgi:(2R)-3-sulfolactate dehydrogenase (NADP+)